MRRAVILGNSQLTEETSNVAERMKTGSSAASNRSYLAIKAIKGSMRSGTMIMRLIIATNTVLFSPG